LFDVECLRTKKDISEVGNHEQLLSGISDGDSSDTSEIYSHGPLIETPKKKAPSRSADLKEGELQYQEVEQEQDETANFGNQNMYIGSTSPLGTQSAEESCSASESSESSQSEYEASGTEDEEADDDSDDSESLESSLKLYPGSAITSANFDTLLLAIFQKHHMPDAAKDDLLKLFQLALPEENNAAASSYRFNKRNEECLIDYTHVQVCPSCHEKIEREVCQNSD